MSGETQLLHAVAILRRVRRSHAAVEPPPSRAPLVPRGYRMILAACLLSALMGALLELALLRMPELPAVTIAFLRVLANMAFFLALSPRQGLRSLEAILRGRGDKWLWIWGLLGAVTIAAMFAAVPRIGVGPTSVLTSTSGAFTAFLAPLVLGGRWQLPVLAAVGASFSGVVLMHPLSAAPVDSLGWGLGLLSGLAAGVAYLALARAGGRHAPATVMAYWSTICLAAFALWLSVEAPLLPTSPTIWALVLGAGFCAAWAQYCTTQAYAAAPAQAVAALSYLAPVLVMIVDNVAFGVALSPRQALGAVIIVLSGIGVALVQRRGAPASPSEKTQPRP
jgi:drug/metabolite transporter (DMT)-like permease